MKGLILPISLNTLQYFKLPSMLQFISPNIKHYLIIYVTYLHDFLNSCAGGDQDLCSKLISQTYALQTSDKPQCLYVDSSIKFSRAEMSSLLLSFCLSLKKKIQAER